MKVTESFLPHFCSVSATFLLIAFSLLLAFVLTIDDLTSAERFWPELGLRLLFITWTVLVSGGILCLLRPRLAAHTPLRIGLVAIAVIEAVALLLAFAARSLPVMFTGSLASAVEPGMYYSRVLLVTGLIASASLRYLFVQTQWRAQARAEGEARLDALQARMRPHFLFNSLNTIASFTRSDPERAEDLVLDLAELLRAILKTEGHLVPLADEVELTRRYLNIEQQRLGERLEVRWDLARIAGTVRVPPLSLQPLVENAIRHGIEPSSEGGRIEITGHGARQGQILTVRNTLPAGTVIRDQRGNRLALANLRARLESCFAGEAQLWNSVVDGCYQVRLVLPNREARDEDIAG